MRAGHKGGTWRWHCGPMDRGILQKTEYVAKTLAEALYYVSVRPGYGYKRRKQ